MTNYRAILEYHYKGNTTTQVARICECSRTTVLKTIKRAKECGLELSLFDKTSDYDLLKKLYPKRVRKEEYAAPNFYELEKDKKKRKLTIFVMWRRYYKRTLAAGLNPLSRLTGSITTENFSKARNSSLKRRTTNFWRNLSSRRELTRK